MNCIKRNSISGFPNQNNSSRGFTWVAMDGPFGSAISSANKDTTCWSFVPNNMTSFNKGYYKETQNASITENQLLSS